MIFALARMITKADTSVKSGLWLKDDLVGIEIHNKVLGIIGVGQVGSQVANLAAGLGMTILGYDPYRTNEQIKQLGAEPVEFRNLLSRSDFVSLHIPLSPETRNLINGQTISYFKRGARLINTARGGLIDETALLGGLESGQIGGAALDVFSKEPPGMSALACHPKVVATPHLGAQTIESQTQVAIDIAEEVLAVLLGKPLRWKVI
jgi:phosphoglycerate dehydrogenase-like enzyme